MNMDKIKVVIIGTGDMANRHIQGWEASGMAEIVAVVGGRNQERLDGFMKEHGIENGGQNCCEILEKFKPDAVSVCLPVFLHPEMVRIAAENGAHVLCEKPLALTSRECREMVDVCKKHDVMLGVDFQRRYWEDAMIYRKLIEEGKYGRPLYWKRLDIRSIRPKILMHDKNGNGGVVVDCTVHWFDLWRKFFNSEPVSIYAKGHCFGKDKPELASIREEDRVIDTAQITVEFASGDIGELSTTWGLPEGVPTLDSDTIVGPQGYTHFDGQKLSVGLPDWR